ncbi:MAG: SDR family NAD(P)-dependent oxidoreductase [Alphaproteobacteria bacterium]|nr:SDR family NAD(P)-dependent oxidoreductase [Alphaproteobacteria bacterium]
MQVKDRLLEGRVAIVTGGARGIGRAIAEDFVRHGAQVVVVDPGNAIDGSGQDVQAVREEAGKLGERALAIAESVASPEAARMVVARTRERFGAVDIVVNNAAILRDAFIFKGEPADWEAVIRTNLSAAFYLLTAATPFMREQARAGRGGGSWGRVLNMVSSVGLYGNLGQSAYAAAKAGLFGLTRTVAMDMARSGVACNGLVPFAATRVTHSIRPQNPAQESYKARALKIAPGHVARVASWLCSDHGAGITGQLVGVRGREIFLFSQPRPAARLVAQADWQAADFAAAAARDFGPHYATLTTDLETFDTEPLI